MKYVIFPAVLFIFFINSLVVSALETSRAPIAAGRFYPADADVLKQAIKRLIDHADLPAATDDKALKALIMPHAGYACSGQLAAMAAKLTHGMAFQRVIAIGPDHCAGIKHAAVTCCTYYETPLGKLRVDDDARRLCRQSSLFEVGDASDRCEHAVENVLPFLQFMLPEFTLIAVSAGQTDPTALSREIDHIYSGSDLLVVSTDLSHYLDYDTAVERDQKTIDAVLKGQTDYFTHRRNIACGAAPIAILIELARAKHWTPALIGYANSGDTCAGRNQVVGYAAIAFYGESSMSDQTDFDYTPSQGQRLIRVARATIAEKLGIDYDARHLSEHTDDACLTQPRATFVTLTIDGRLRGCIGSLEARESLLKSVRNNAVNAAFHDPRFSPLSRSEFDEIDIEVSILTPSQPLNYKDDKELVAKLRPHVDGVILRKGFAGATFLPQVWDQLPDVRDFLGHLCRKAGLAANAWKTDKLEVMTYQVQYFHEKR